MFRVAIWPQNGAEENQWDYVLSNIQPDEIYVLGSYFCTNNILRDAPRAETFDDLPGEIVLLAPLSSRNFVPTTSLLDFVHPADACYVFGPNNEHLSEEDVAGSPPDHVIYIPTDTTDELFNYSAYLLTAWHRRYG